MTIVITEKMIEDVLVAFSLGKNDGARAGIRAAIVETLKNIPQMTVTEAMIEAGCRERCSHERLNADSPVHYVNSEMFPHMHFAADPLPAHVVGGPRWDGQPITQHKSMPQWRWKFYKSVKRELEAALAVEENPE